MDFAQTWYEEDDISSPKDDLIYECKENVRAIVRQLYSNDTIDYKDLSYSIEELCHLLKLKMPQTSLTIDRKKRSNIVSLDTFAEFTKKYAKTLN